MNLQELSFDNFLSLPKSVQDEVLNDYELIKVMLRKNISEHRYLHSISVAKTCEELAKRHNVDVKKAYLAGLLHDCCKFRDESKLIEYMQKYEKDKLGSNVGIYHSWVAPYYLREKLDFKDEEILNAIYNHTILNSDDKLSLILYIADKREPLRNINDGILQKANSDLFGAYQLLKKDVEDYINTKNERLIKNSI